MSELLGNISRRPYFDTSESEYKRGYRKVLFRPEVSLQSRELLVESSFLENSIKNIGDQILNNGSIISGCSVYISPSDAIDLVAYITAGVIYYNGMLIDVPRTEWRNSDYEYLKQGAKYICLEVTKIVITSADDATLYDPATTSPNYGLSGANRLKYQARAVIYSDSDLEIIYNTDNNDDDNVLDIIDIISTEDGEITGTTQTSDATGKITESIARNIYDTSGNFIVQGMRTRIESDPSNIASYYINLYEGKCYVLGKEFNFPTQKIKINSKLEFKELIQEESHTFQDGIFEYYLNHNNFRDINQIQVTIQNNRLLMTKSTTDIDNVVDTQGMPLIVKEIRSAYPDSENPSEREYVDWIKDGNRIIWTKNGRRPSQGSTYYIDASYNKKLREGIDYIIIKDENGTKIVFIGSDITNNLPEPGTDFYISYSYYLERYDLLYIDIAGNPKVLNGISGEEYEIFIPQVPINVLPIAWIKVDPNLNPENYQYYEYSIYRMSTADIRNVQKRVSDIEFDVSMLKLEIDAQKTYEEKSEDGLSSLRGIYVDGFDNYDKIDFYHPLYKINVDIFSKEITLPYHLQAYGIKDLLNNNIIDTITNTVYDSNNIQSSNMICLPYTEIKNNIQEHATDSLSLNPYSIHSNIPYIRVSPSFGIFHDSLILNSKNVTANMLMNLSNTKIEEIENIINVESAYDILPKEYMDTNEIIELYGNNFENDQYIEIFFDNKSIRPISVANYNTLVEVIQINGDDQHYYDLNYALPTYIETTNGHYLVKVSTGVGCSSELKVNFKIPPNVRTGKIKIITKIYTKSDDEYTLLETKGNAYYYGMNYLDEYYYLKNKTNSIYDSCYDINSAVEKTTMPIGQSFKYNEDTFISSIDLFFAENNTSSISDIIFDIREFNNGIPSDVPIYQDIILSENFIGSQNGSIPLHLHFKYPVYIKGNIEYIFTLSSSKQEYKIWYSKTGNVDKITNQLVESNSNFGNVYLSSSGQYWSVIADSDIKYSFYRAKFENTAEYNLKDFINTINIGKFGTINLAVHNLVLDETNIICKYLPINEGEWINLSLNEKINLENINMEDFKIKFILTSNNDKLTPFINMNTIKIFIGAYETDGSYVMRTFYLGSND